MDWYAHFSQANTMRNNSSFGAETAASAPANSVAKVKGIERLTKSQLVSLDRAASALGIPVDWLAAVISFETAGSFSTTIPNAAGSGAFGLIQFMPATAQNLLKTATREEAVKKGKAMSFDEQLQKMVIPYFRPYASRLKTLNDVYLAVFYPAAMSKADDHVVATQDTTVYRQNAGFDKEKKGFITRADITRTVTNVLSQAGGLPRVAIGGSQFGQIVAGVGLAVGLTYMVSVNTNLLPFGKGKFEI